MHWQISVDSSQHGKKCLAYRKPLDYVSSNEDCLFLGVYVPSNATSGAKLPVFFIMQLAASTSTLVPILIEAA
jgi:carboxylesterase type B